MNIYRGLYSDIGKKARDLLYKDYADQHPQTYFSYQSFKWHLDISCETPEILPGFTTLFGFLIPDSCKVDLRFLHDYIGVSSGVGLKAFEQGSFKGNGYNPIVNFSGVLGSDILSLGTDVAFDVSRSRFDQLKAGLSFNSAILDTSLILDDRLNTLKASCYHAFNPLTRTAIATELKHSFSNKGTTTLTIGAQHALLPFALVKARLDTKAKIGGVIRFEFWGKLLLALAGEVDIRNANVSKVGFSVALNP